MLKRKQRLLVSRRVLITGGVSASLLAAAKARAQTPFTTYAWPATGRTHSATAPDRASDTLNAIRDFGCDPGGINDTTAQVQAAVTAWANVSPHSAADLYFPPGDYKVISPIDISNSTGNNSGIIRGAGKGASQIIGNISNNFVCTRRNSVGGPARMSDMTITNQSTNIGTGALRFLNSTGSLLENIQFNGNIGLDCGWNSFNLGVVTCDFAPASVNIPGTNAIISNGCNLRGARSTNFDLFFTAFGNNGHDIGGNSIEETNCAWALGIYQGWASACTVSGTTLTVGGELSPVASLSSTQPNFQAGDFLYGPGITFNAWGTLPLLSGGTTIVSQLTNTNSLGISGQEGTYQLSQSYSISSPVPMFTRRLFSLSVAVIDGFETEGCIFGLFAANMTACAVRGGTMSGVVGEGAAAGGGEGLTAHSGIYIHAAGSSVFESMKVATHCYAGSIYFEPGATTPGLSFRNSTGQVTSNAVSDSAATISGTTMTINSVVSGTFGVGMTITGSGVTANTTIVQQLTGTPGGAGTYKVSASQTVGATTLTALGGPAWVLPTASSTDRAGIGLDNCNNPALVITFNELPGQPGCDNTNIAQIEGQRFRISDSGTATSGNFGATVSTGGGSNHVTLEWTGAAWIIVG